MRALLITVLIVFAILLLVSLAGGPIIRTVVNRRLASLPGFTGHVTDVSLSLWRGKVQVEDATLRERSQTDSRQPPLAHVGHTEANVALMSLLRGKLRLEILVSGADIHFSPPPPAAEGQAKDARKEVVAQPVRWRAELQKSFPVEITRLEVRNSALHYVDATKQPRIEVGLDQLHLVATGLQTRAEPGATQRPARLDLTAVTTGNGQLTLQVDADPWRDTIAFQSRLQLRGLQLPALNPFLLEYANADVSAGTFDFDSEVTAEGGHYEGYVKPFFRDLDFRTASDRDKNAAELLAKKAVSAVASLLKNDEEQKVATKVPFRGDLQTNDVDVWETVVNLLRNAFVQGIKEGFDGQRPRR